MIVVNDTRIGSNADFAISKSIKRRQSFLCTDGGREINQNLHDISGIVFDLGHFYLSLIVGGKDGVN